ncbi:SDR family NAD(P)-dependent oxidoreductase [Ideonella alba]|uniref:SDR family NAD(P)-dependent oxidoreductase n=1 Tax=Ideonella alba TaxID=2824118 RepID=A0A940Y8C6_9BURK|nr:SDR family NAD(P)-dependent oxidoreductase [Ideonella alba]MBQ0930531.1 SDR family NAD(P)-dependent oxidoreductase [Ideonella alba]
MSLNPPLADWRERHVWIVGASSGIGAALAAALHERGARVTVSARRLDALQALERQHPGLRPIALDVTDAAALEASVERLFSSNPPDLVCYCAGHYEPGGARELSLRGWEQHRAVNLDAAVALSLAVLRPMRARGHGHLSLVSSVAGHRGLPNALAYGTTKAALTHFSEALHLELAPLGVGISVVTPGFVETPMTAVNDFRMPAVITPAQAAQAILAGWARGRFMIDFPRRFTFWLDLLRCLPYAWYFPLVRRLTRR